MKVYYDDHEITLERLGNGDYRITMFNAENHWSGEVVFNSKEGIIYDALTPNKNGTANT